MDIKVIPGPKALNLFTENLSGEIYSVHSSSFYALFPDQEVILFHEDNCGIIPFGIAVRDLKQILGKMKLEKGMQMVYCDSGITIPEADVRLRFYQPHQHAIGEENIPIAAESVIVANVQEAAGFLMENGSKAGVGSLVYLLDDLLKGSVGEGIETMNPFCRSCYKSLMLLIEAIMASDTPNIKIALDGLMGLGPGLTPSMDDVLVGMLSAFCFFNRKLPYTIKGLDPLQELILTRSHLKTSRISAAYLHAAARGERFTLIDHAIEEILHNSSREDRNRSFSRLLAIGSNSGTEMFLGIILAFRILFKSMNLE